MRPSALRLTRRAGPDRSAIPNLPALPPWLGAVIFAGVIAVITRFTVPAIGLPFYPGAVIGAGMLLGGVSQPAAQRWLSGGHLDRRAGPRILLAMTAFSVLAFGCGLPSMVPVFALIVASVHLHWSGWRIWRLVAVQSAAFTLVGELVVHLGLIPSAMPAGRDHALAGVMLAAGTQALSILGMTTRRREEIEHRLRRTESRFRALVQNSQDVVGIITRDTTVLYVSPSVVRLTDVPPSRLQGQRLGDLLPRKAAAVLNAAMIRTEAAGTGQTEEVEIVIHDGTARPRWVEMVVTNLLDDPAVGGFVLNASDVTERRQYQEQLVHAATHDLLTGLLNRAAFVTALQRELASVSPTEQAWLFFCDLDGFKGVNDRLGHDAGDAVLVHTAAALSRQAGPRALVGRFGGDEFCVLVPPGPGRGDSPHELRDLLAEAVAQTCRTPGGESVRVEGSFGLVCLDGRELLADAVLREADQRMYERKRQAAAQLR